MMYTLFMPLWKDQTPVSRVSEHMRYRRIVPPKPASLPQLPARCAAARFYSGNCFPDTPDNRAFVARVIDALAEHADVVMMNPAFRLDDHVDYAVATRSRIRTFEMSSRAAENFAWQSSIIAGAHAFIRTYGEFAYLAPFCGVKSIALYSDRNYFTYHLSLPQRAFAKIGSSSIDVSSIRMLDSIFESVAARDRVLPRPVPRGKDVIS
jgi:hypothetical protein